VAEIAGAARRHVDPARVGLGVGHKFRNGSDWQRRVDQHDERIIVDASDWHDVARDIDVGLFVERHIDGVRRCNKQQRVAICGRPGDGLEREVAAGTWPVLDHDRLAKPLRQSLADQPSDDIGRAARRGEDHERDRPRRVALRPAGARHRSEDSQCSELQKMAAPNFHDGLP